MTSGVGGGGLLELSFIFRKGNESLPQNHFFNPYIFSTLLSLFEISKIGLQT